MKFELPGLTFGPTDGEIERLGRHRPMVRVAADPESETAQAAALKLSAEGLRRLRAALDALRRA